MAADGTIKIDTKIDDKNLKPQLKKISGSITKGLKVAAKGAGVALAGITVAIGAIAKGAKEFTVLTREVNAMAKMAGVGAEAFQELAYAAGQYGITQDDLADGLKELQLRTDEYVKTGAGTAVEAFERLGFTQEELNEKLKDAPALFEEVIDRMTDMDKAAQIRISDELFGGTAGEKFVAIVDAGAGSVAKLREEAQSLGVVMSQDMIDSGVILGQSFEKLSTLGKGLFTEVFSGIVPALTRGSEALVNWVSGQGGVQGIVEKIRDLFRRMGDGIQIMWVKTIAGIQRLWMRYVAGFKIDAANMEMAFTIAMNGIKKAIWSVSSAISGSLLKGVENLLNVMGKMPFVGEKFQEASAAVANFNQGLQDGYNEMIAANEQAIQKAKEERDAVIEAENAALAAHDAATNAKISNILKESEAEAAARKAASDAQREADLAAAKQAAADKARVESIQTLLRLQSTYEKAVLSSQQKAKDGFITQEELQEALTAAAEEYAEALYDIGVTAESAAEDGGDALRGMLDILTDSRTKSDAEDAGQDMGMEVVDGVEEGLMMNISGVLGVVKAIGAAIGKALSFASKFDPTALYTSFIEFIDGLEDFFMTDLGTIPIFFDMAADAAAAFAQGLLDNLPNILKTMETVIIYMADRIIQDGPMLAEALVETLVGSIVAILNSGGKILEAAFAIITGILTGLRDNMSELVDGILNFLLEAIVFIAENLADYSILGYEIVMAIIVGVIEALPELILALVDALPQIITALIMMRPQIIAAIVGMIPELVSALLGAIPQILAALPAMGVAIIEGIVNGVLGSAGALFSAVGDAVGDAISGAGDFFSNTASAVGSFFGFAGGTKNAPGGVSLVGEEGPELVNLPKGSQVYTAAETAAILKGVNGAGIGGMSQMAGMGAQVIQVNIVGSLDVDGEQIGRISYEYLDKVSGA